MKTLPSYLQILFNLIRIILVVVTVREIYLQMHRPLISANNRSGHNPSAFLAPSDQNCGFTADEKRIAHRFLNDTLPGLIQMGLVKRYERRESGTLITVAGHVWKRRSQFFRLSFLTEVMEYNKVNGYEFRTQVKDSISGNLYAEISSQAKMKFYD